MGEWKALKKASGTGWKGLERQSGTGWRMLYWEGNIDVGAEALSYSSTMPIGYTIVTKYNPVNADGKIDKVDIYVGTEGTFYVGIYEYISATQVKCKDIHNCGILTVGLHSDIAVDLDVLTGEYIGAYSSDGGLRYGVETSGDRWYKEAACITVGTTYTMTFSENDVKYAVYGSNY